MNRIIDLSTQLSHALLLSLLLIPPFDLPQIYEEFSSKYQVIIKTNKTIT